MVLPAKAFLLGADRQRGNASGRSAVGQHLTPEFGRHSPCFVVVLFQASGADVAGLFNGQQTDRAARTSSFGPAENLSEPMSEEFRTKPDIDPAKPPIFGANAILEAPHGGAQSAVNKNASWPHTEPNGCKS
jgi:hypothetical protein